VINAAKMHGDDDLIEWQPASGVIPMGENWARRKWGRKADKERFG